MSIEPRQQDQQSAFIPRAIAGQLVTSLGALRGVMLVGPRQSGKSTLVRSLDHGRYVTLDDGNNRRLAMEDPAGFLEAIGVPATIDEVQRVPDLLLELKQRMDLNDRRGMYLLTGSADVLALSRTADTLVGRVAVHDLHPLTQSEIERARPEFLDRLFGDSRPRARDAASIDDLVDRVLRGGFPEAVRAPDGVSRATFLNSYVRSIVERDLPAVADIQHRTAVPRLLRLLAARSPGQLNISSLATDAGVPRTTLDRYLALLTLIFLIRLSTPWHSGATSREVKQPRLLFTDTGVLARLRRASDDQLRGVDRAPLGVLLENMVGGELRTLASLSADILGVHHWRTQRGHEVDFVVEHASLQIVGVEVKVSRTVSSSDARGLRRLREVAGARYHRGVILYGGSLTVRLADGIEAWPIQSLWDSECEWT